MKKNNNPAAAEPSGLAVMDINEIKQKSRLQRILHTRDEVEEKAGKARTDYIEGNITQDGRNITIFTAVQRYIREAHNLLYDAAQSLESITYNNVTGETKKLGQITFETKDNIEIWTLRDYYEADEIYIENVTKEIPARHGPNIVDEKPVQHTMPARASWRAYILLNLFLGQNKGIQIQMEELEVDEHADPF